MRFCLLTAVVLFSTFPAVSSQENGAGAPSAPSATAGGFQAETVNLGDESFAFQLLKPATVEAGKRYPVVLFLHGSGERGTDNKAQLKHFAGRMATPEMQAKYPCYLIAVQCLPDQKWNEVDWNSRVALIMAPKPNQMQDYAMAALEKVKASHAVDPARIILTGLSMGGYGAWELSMRHPDLFCCVAPVCGGGDDSKAALIKDIPVWAWHGSLDEAVPVERSRTMVAAIKAAGGKQVKYTELEGVGHDSWTTAYTPASGLLDWMFAQKKVTASGASVKAAKP